MRDMIYRQAAINAVVGWFCDLLGVEETSEDLGCLARLRELPSAQPEPIRCKDCKHWKIGTKNLNCPNPMVCGLHSFMHGFERASLPEDYCSWAERRTDDEW